MMAEENQTIFTPSEIWTPDSEIFDIGESIEKARYKMNETNPKTLIKNLKSKVKKSPLGIMYAVLDGERQGDYSKTDALVLFSPFANDVAANGLVKGEFIRLIAKEEGLRDQEGKLKPVILLASPGLSVGSHLNLNKDDLQQIKKGNLGPAAEQYLRAITEQEYGRVALMGYSGGADMALASATAASRANLDTSRLAIGDPAGVQERNALEIGLDFLRSSTDFQKSIDATDLDVQRKVAGNNVFSPRRSINFAKFGLAVTLNRANHALWAGMSKNNFEKCLQEVIDNNSIDRIVIGYGADSLITRPGSIEPILHNLYQAINRDKLISVKVDKATHAWGDQLTLLAKLYMRALV